MFLAHFGPFFSILGQKNFFLRKFGSVTRNFIWVSSTMPNFRKNLWYNYKKMAGQEDWWKYGQTLFYRALPATAKGPKTDWHEDIYMDTKTKKKFKRSTLSLVNAGPPDWVSVLFTKCGGCHPNGLIVASSHKVKQIIIILKFIYLKANSLFC